MLFFRKRVRKDTHKGYKVEIHPVKNNRGRPKNQDILINEYYAYDCVFTIRCSPTVELVQAEVKRLSKKVYRNNKFKILIRVSEPLFENAFQHTKFCQWCIKQDNIEFDTVSSV